MSINCTMFTESQKNGIWIRDNSASWNKVISKKDYNEMTSPETIRKLKKLGGKVTITRYPDGNIKEIISDFSKKNARGIKTVERCHYIFNYTNENKENKLKEES